MSKTETSVPDYIEYKNSMGIVTKVVNFDSPKMCPNVGTIEIIAIRISNRHENRKSFSVTRDPNTGIHYGIPTNFDKDGVLKFKRIVIYNKMQLNLKNPTDRQLWAVISRCEFLKGSPLAAGKPEYEVFDREKEAQVIIIENKSKRRASGIIDNLTPLEMYDMARNCGFSVENDTLGVIQSLLYKKAENNPGEFLEIWDNVNRPVLTVFKRGIVTGMIRFDATKGYLWKESLPLGANDAQVVKYLLQNISMLVTMDQETKERDKIWKENASDEDHKKTVLEALSNENNAHIQTYSAHDVSKNNSEEKNRLAEKEAELEKELQEMRELKEQMKAALSAPKTVNSVQEEDPELISLREQAAKLGKRGANMMKDKDALKAFIKEAEDVIN